MLRVLKWLFIILLLAFFGLVGFGLSSIQDKPIVLTNSAQQVDQAESVKALIEQLSRTLKNRRQQQTIHISQDQLNSLIGFAQRANLNVQGRANVQATGTVLALSYRLPDNPLGQYLNVSALILPAKGLDIAELKIGPYSVSGYYALSTLIWLADSYTKSDIASQFVAQLESIHMNDENLVLTTRPLEGFLQQLNELQQGFSLQGDDQQRVNTAHYLKYLHELGLGRTTKARSLAAYMGPVFSEAQRRSLTSDVVAENEAAILALTIYAGHHRFANIVGEVQPVAGKVTTPWMRPVLAKRVDLNQHFIISAGLYVLSQQGFSAAVGEFKELMDRGTGGSGFSFVDLAADMAGVAFAQALSDPNTASRSQSHLANVSEESVFFPPIKGLPEGLSKADFTQAYGQIDSPEYLTVVKDIEQRIRALPLYQ